MRTHNIFNITIILISAFFFLFAGSPANATVFNDDPGLDAKFSVTKRLCLGHLAGDSNANQCVLAPQVGANTPVSYIFIVGNPWGEPPQLITLEDNYPNGFSPSGGVQCMDDQGTSVALIPGITTPEIAKFILEIGREVTCVVNGEFTNSGTKVNRVDAENNSQYTQSSEVSTHIVPSQPTGVDLSVSKTASPSNLDLTSTGMGTLKYNITITNNGPSDVFVGDHFTLHDRLSLLPNSIPFRAELVSASCNSSNTSNTDCLDPSDISPYGSPDVLVGTMGVANFLKWSFSGGKGNIANGESIYLTFIVKVSAIEGIKCVVSPTANGIRNSAFFTLLSDQGSALTESNASNNTGNADISLTTGYQSQTPNCGRAHLELTKEQFFPNPSSKVAWNSNVVYDIKIKNVSVPAQKITINKDSLQDWVTEGLNTPPFTRVHLDTNCYNSTSPAVCSNFNSSLNPEPDLTYTYYTQTERAWDNGNTFVLNHGDVMELKTTFKYKDPDCETVPNAKKKPIINTVQVSYKATQFGASSTTPQSYTFSQSDKAETLMKDQPPCKFKVQKKVTDPSGLAGAQLLFGQPHIYNVQFRNDGPKRKIGTVMDALRISKPNYATQLDYVSSWKCTGSGVANFTTSGTETGTISHTSTPAQGSTGIQVRPSGANAITFGSGGVLKCTVKIEIKRPPFGANFCSAEETRLENLGLMDVTYPFNPNIAWPPSGVWNQSGFVEPNPQDKNWAISSVVLPRCLDGQVNKEGLVTGLPGSSDKWNYEGGPDINWNMTITNTGDSAYTGSGNWNGVRLDDETAPPYANSTFNNSVCSPASSCNTSPLGDRSKRLANLASGADMTWSGATAGADLVSNTDIENCVEWELSGSRDPSLGLYYTNYEYPIPSGSTDPSPYRNCETIPIIPTTSINITKEIIDDTGAGITTGGPFDFNVACNPYELFAGVGQVSLNAGQSGTVTPVPVRSSCTITETSMPPVPQAAINACGNLAIPMQAAWDEPSFSPSSTLTGSASSPLSLNQIDVVATNKLICKPVAPPETVQLTITKKFRQGNKLNWDIGFDINCTPNAAQPSQASLTYPDQQTLTINVPVGSTCEITEILPPLPQEVKDGCPNFYQANWNAPEYSPSNTFTVGTSNLAVDVGNKFSCGLPKVKKVPLPSGGFGTLGTSSGTTGGTGPKGPGTIGPLGPIETIESPVIDPGKIGGVKNATKWTSWLNSDRPGGSGDYEIIDTLSKRFSVCSDPVDIQCRTTRGKTDWKKAGEKYQCDVSRGGLCANNSQKDRRCQDYEVRLLCGE